jgi:uncharacterized protein DUF3857
VAPSEFRSPCLFLALLLCCFSFLSIPIEAQQQPAPSTGKPTEPQTPAQIELLETKIRIESNGDSRKEVHTRVQINSELGVRQFARLHFDYNRSFESIELPLVRITHPSGGTVDILPGEITDNPNPAALNAPAYQDVRVKSVRILGLAPGDLLEYRVITTVTHHPLAPDFWLDHSFDRTGVVTREVFEFDVPARYFEPHQFSPVQPLPKETTPEGAPDLKPPPPPPHPPQGRIHISPQFPEAFRKRVDEGSSAHLVYAWDVRPVPSTEQLDLEPKDNRPPDIAVTSVNDWFSLAERIKRQLYPWRRTPGGLQSAKLEEFIRGFTRKWPLEGEYRFVSEKIKTVDLPLGATGFRSRKPGEILSSGYATPEDKAVLLLSLIQGGSNCDLILFASNDLPSYDVISPSLFNRILLVVSTNPRQSWFLDPALEVAPYGVVSASLRGKTGLILDQPGFGFMMGGQFTVSRTAPTDLPFPSSQHVAVDATLGMDGNLHARVKYTMRGDNELLLRLAFHRAPKEKWKDLAQLLSISDGFRGKVTSVTLSDPYATGEPFTLDYEITMPKFVDWSKKPVHVPALLPQIGLPDPPAKPSSGAAASPIELGTPLEVATHMTLHLPSGTTIQTPTGTSVQRDYAAFTSQYSANGTTITAARRINFLLRQVPAERAADYNAFLRAVQNDEAQDFTLDHTVPPAPNAKPAAPAVPPPSTPKP